jgi:hypothetical protein
METTTGTTGRRICDTYLKLSEGKANLTKLWQDFFCVIDNAGLCIFYSVRNLSDLELEILPDGGSKGSVCHSEHPRHRLTGHPGQQPPQ